MIAEKLFNSFTHCDDEISYKDLQKPFSVLKFGSLEDISQILFNLFDFDSDKKVYFSDIRLLLSYMPSEIDVNDPNFYLTSPSLGTIKQQIDDLYIQLLAYSFLDINDFTNIFSDKIKKNGVEYNNIFMTFLCYLYENIPVFQDNSITKSYIDPKMNLESTIDNSLNFSISDTSFDYRKKLPTRKPESTDLTEFHVHNFKLLEEDHLVIKRNSVSFNNKCFKVYNKRLNLHQLNEENSNQELVTISNDEVMKEGNFYILDKTIINPSLAEKSIKIIKNTLYIFERNEGTSENNEKRLRPQKLRLLIGCFIRKNPLIKINKEVLYSFTIFFPNEKKETFYNKNQVVVTEWSDYLRGSLKYRNIFDIYTMNTVIGEGSQGKVFKSEDNLTKEKVAIKVLNKKVDKRCKWTNIRTEIDIMKVVNHPNIISFIDNYENSEFNFIVMEYLQYGSLQKYLETCKFNVKETILVNVAYQIVEGLNYLHNLGILHRDLKPGNVLISSISDEVIHVKIADFGLSKILSKYEFSNERGGTFLFLAPEVVKKEHYNCKIDVWSFGITFYYMIFGKFPFPITKKRDVYNLEYADSSYITSESFKRKSESFQDLIIRCLDVDVSKRMNLCEVLNHSFFDKCKSSSKD